MYLFETQSFNPEYLYSLFNSCFTGKLGLIYAFTLGFYIFLYLLTVQYRFVQPMRRTFTVPVVNEKGYVLKQWRLFRSVPHFSCKLKTLTLYNYLSKFTLATLLLLALPVWIYVGPDLSFWFDHCRLSPSSLKIILLLIFISAITLSRLHFIYPKSNSLLQIILLQLFVLLPMWFFWLYTSTNIYTFIFSIELLNILVFVILSASQLSYETLTVNRGRFGLIVFFWMSTVSSITLFSFIVIYTYVGFSLNWNTIFLTEMWLSSLQSSELQYTTLLLIFFMLIVFLKAGLPPLFFWKSLLFSNLSIPFIAFYTTLYYFPLFSYFILSIFPYISYLQFSTSTGLIVSILAPIMLIITSFITQKAYTLNVFLAFSSFATSSLIVFTVLMGSLTAYTFITTQLISALLYLICYTLTLLVFFTLVVNLVNFNNPGTVTFSSLFSTSTLSSFTLENSLIRNILILVLASMAGLPPLVSFMAKLALLSFINLINFSVILVLFFTFLFLILIFYFQNSRFLLTQYSGTATFNVQNRPMCETSKNLQTYNISLYSDVRFIYVICVFILFGFPMYSDSFILTSWITI